MKHHDPYSRIGDITEYEAPSHDEILDGDWWLVKDAAYGSGVRNLTYRTLQGYVTEYYYESGSLESQSFLGKNFEPAQDANKWTEKNWNKDGVLTFRGKCFFPEVRNTESFETLSKVVDEAGGALVEYEFFYDDGVLESRRTWFKHGGQLYQKDSEYSPDGSLKSRGVTDFHLNACAPENDPSFLFYEGGEISLAEYMVERGGESVYHRTDGPAIFNRFAPEGQQERYFLEGKEYTKAEWEEKTGNV